MSRKTQVDNAGLKDIALKKNIYRKSVRNSRLDSQKEESVWRIWTGWGKFAPEPEIFGVDIEL